MNKDLNKKQGTQRGKHLEWCCSGCTVSAYHVSAFTVLLAEYFCGSKF